MDLYQWRISCIIFLAWCWICIFQYARIIQKLGFPAKFKVPFLPLMKSTRAVLVIAADCFLIFFLYGSLTSVLWCRTSRFRILLAPVTLNSLSGLKVLPTPTVPFQVWVVPLTISLLWFCYLNMVSVRCACLCLLDKIHVSLLYTDCFICHACSHSYLSSKKLKEEFSYWFSFCLLMFLRLRTWLTLTTFMQYEPELFPGLIYRMKQPKIVLLIFVSGKIVITGAKVL